MFILQPKLKKEGLATLIAEWSEKDDEVKSQDASKDDKMSMKLIPELVIKIFKKFLMKM